MSNKRGLDNADNALQSATKRRKLNTSSNDNDKIALLTLQMAPPILTYIWFDNETDRIPMWICGNSTQTRICHMKEDDDAIHLFTPSEFLTKCEYPLIRFCNIPAQRLSNLTTHHWRGDKINYSNQSCLKYEIDNVQTITKWISTHIDYFQNNFSKIIARKISDQTVGTLSHLFIIKEYLRLQARKWSKIIEEIQNGPFDAYILPIDIIRYAIFEYIPAVHNNKDINFLNCDQNINQSEWFEYMFYMLEFSTKLWQQFCYENILQNGEFDTLIVNVMRKYKKLALRKFKCPLLTALCIKLYPYSFKTSNITGLIRYTIDIDAEDLFDTCMTLLDAIAPSVFWGNLFFSVVEIVEEDQLYLFEKLCLKMKEHCNGNEKVINASFKKFNANFCDPLKHTNCDEITAKCIKIMANLLDYDIYTLIPYCAEKNNIKLVNFLLDRHCIDQNLCQENYSKEMNKLLGWAIDPVLI